MGLDFFRLANWLDAARARDYLRLVALLNIAALVWLLATSHGGIDRNGFLIGTDFLSFWTSGRMALAGGNVYDAAAHIAAQREYFAPRDAFTAFFYPPSFLLFCAPLGLLGYFPALAAWLAVTGAVYLAAVRGWLKTLGLALPLPVLFAAFPPVLITITHGQTSFLVAALLGGGALLVPSRPWLAGALLGIAAIKPQFGLLVPLVLVLTGEWRTIAGAVLGAAAMALAAALAFGPQVWADWLHVGAAAQAALDAGEVGYAKMQSPFAAMMLLGAPTMLAYAVQGAVSLGVAVAVARASWRRRFGVPLAALMLSGAPLVTPFVLDYDMVLLAFPLLWLAAQDFYPGEKLTLAVTFIAPAFARPLGLAAGVPIMPVILLALFIVMLRRASETHARPSGAGEGAWTRP